MIYLLQQPYMLLDLVIGGFIFLLQCTFPSHSILLPHDLHMVELEDFKYGGTNITALRLVDPSNEKVCSDL